VGKVRDEQRQMCVPVPVCISFSVFHLSISLLPVAVLH